MLKGALPACQDKTPDMFLPGFKQDTNLELQSTSRTSRADRRSHLVSLEICTKLMAGEGPARSLSSYFS